MSDKVPLMHEIIGNAYVEEQFEICIVWSTKYSKVNSNTKNTDQHLLFQIYNFLMITYKGVKFVDHRDSIVDINFFYFN